MDAYDRVYCILQNDMGDHEQAHNTIRTKKPVVSGGGLGTKDETKILKHWGYLKKTLHLAHIVDPLIEKGVLTIDRWMALKSKSISEAERVEEFLYALLKGKPETYSIFLVALKSRGYTQVKGSEARKSAHRFQVSILEAFLMQRPINSDGSRGGSVG